MYRKVQNSFSFMDFFFAFVINTHPCTDATDKIVKNITNARMRRRLSMAANGSAFSAC